VSGGGCAAADADAGTAARVRTLVAALSDLQCDNFSWHVLVRAGQAAVRACADLVDFLLPSRIRKVDGFWRDFCKKGEKNKICQRGRLNWEKCQRGQCITLRRMA